MDISLTVDKSGFFRSFAGYPSSVLRVFHPELQQKYLGSVGTVPAHPLTQNPVTAKFLATLEDLHRNKLTNMPVSIPHQQLSFLSLSPSIYLSISLPLSIYLISLSLSLLQMIDSYYALICNQWLPITDVIWKTFGQTFFLCKAKY